MSRILLLELSHKNLGSATSHLFFRICIGFWFATELVSKLPRSLSECSNLSSHPIFHLSSQNMCRCEHSALLRLSQYAFLHVKPPWKLPNLFHLLLQIFGIHCQTIFLPFQLFLFLEELSNITYSSLLTLTVVQNLVRSNQLNVSHFVIQRQLLPQRRPETPCRPSKSVPSERLRLVEVINFAWATYWRMCKSCVTYLLTYPEGTQVIVGSVNIGYISDTARNRTHNLFRPKREPIPLGHSHGCCLESLGCCKSILFVTSVVST